MENEKKLINFDDLCHFLPIQQKADRAVVKYKYILFGGSMGSSKSYFLRWELIKLLLEYGQKYKIKGLRAMLACEDYPSLRDRHVSKITHEFPEWLGNYNKIDHEFHLDNKWQGVLCLRNLDDASKYMSVEFFAIGIDELTKNRKEVFEDLRTRLRWPDVPDCKFIGTSNPGGVGHQWVKNLFMDRIYEPNEKEAKEFHYVPAKPTDNIYLPESYFNALEGLPEDKRRAYVEGDWSVFGGQYFSEWNREKHVIKPFEMPKEWRKFRAIDFGRTAPFVCLWGALDYDRNVYIYREYYAKGKNADENAREVIALSEEDPVMDGRRYDFTVIDPSVFARTGAGESNAEILYRVGLPCLKANRERIAGWMTCHQYLYHDKKTEPKLKFFDTCVNSIRSIPNLIHDERHNVEDLVGDDDHCVDALRYMLQQLRGGKTKEPEAPLTSGETHFNKVMARNAPPKRNPWDIYDNN